VGDPYEVFVEFGIAFIVDSHAAVVDEPAPGSLDDPAAREHLEARWCSVGCGQASDENCLSLGTYQVTLVTEPAGS
jgi:hypothetical protein